MAGKILKETKDVSKKNKKNNEIEEENIYKINLDNEKKIRTIEDDEDEIDEIFGNVNRWLTEDNLEENLIKEKEKSVKKKRLKKIEEGIKSSKVTKKASTKTEKIKAENEEEEPEVKKAKTTTKRTRKTSKTSTTSKKVKDDVYNIGDLEELNKEAEETIKQSEIKMHTENDITEILLKNNKYKVELQKTEYNVYTEANETSYIIVRDPGLRIVSGGVYILLEKQGEDYEITTNQDFKINYVIDNLERKENIVNFKLTNLTEIVANEDGLMFEIDEEKVIENNLEDNNTLVISEEDGKVYLPYTKEDIKNEVVQNKGTKISEVIEGKYILSLDKYKNSMRARFREGYNLMYRKEGKSKKSAILLGIELMFETNLHPAIISACKNLEELDIYLDCLEDNELEKFSCFKIIYKSLPTLRKKAKFQEL